MNTSVVIKETEQITNGWLTQVLKKSGDLIHGTVASVKPQVGHGNWSSNAILELTYTSDAADTLPPSLFLKMVKTNEDSEDSFGDSEVRYYLEDYIDVPNAPLIRCYDAAYDKEQHCYHLLLADVSATHQPSCFIEPNLAYGYTLAEAVATLHARWWAMQQTIPMSTAEQIERYVNIAKPGLEHILMDDQSELQPHWPGLLQTFIVEHPQALLRRCQTPTGFTLVHGDLNGYNILVPKADRGPLYLIDRQPFDWSLTTWLAVSDLAFVLISDWTVEQRRSCEVPILKHYHQALQAMGITDYSWEQLWHDYQLCVVMGIYNAIEFCKNGVDEAMRGRWQSLLQRSISALEDFS